VGNAFVPDGHGWIRTAAFAEYYAPSFDAHAGYNQLTGLAGIQYLECQGIGSALGI
jgi:hypothetical protein